jgi:hypothetical protein
VTDDRYALRLDGPAVSLVRTDRSEWGVGRVLVRDVETKRGVEGVGVRYRVVDGPLVLSSDEDVAVVETDTDGRAETAARMTAPGNGLLVASLADDERAHSGEDAAANAPFVVFACRTEGVVHRLFVEAEPTVSADAGEFSATVTAVDHRDRPVLSPTLRAEASFGFDTVVAGTVTNDDDGSTVTVPVDVAGEWTLSVADRTTGVATTRLLTVLPGEAEGIELLDDPDPRAESPPDEALVRATLHDAYGNALHPGRLVATVDGDPIEGWTVDTESRFPVRFDGSGVVGLVVSDTDSAIEREVRVPFVPFWVDDPGAVEVGARFRTAVHALPPRSDPFEGATLDVRFDPTQVEFVDYRASPNDPVSVVERDVLTDEGRATVEIAATNPLTAEEWSDGIPVGHVYWRCRGEGRTCVTLTGEPSTESSEATYPDLSDRLTCYTQKPQLPYQKCVCVNVIVRYRARQDQILEDQLIGIDIVREALDRLVSMSTLYECCPFVRAELHHTVLEGHEYIRILKAWKKPGPSYSATPASRADIDWLLDSKIGQRKNCINLYVWPIGVPGLAGRSKVGQPGTMMIDPAAFNTTTDVASHEFGHALGLDDETGLGSRYNVMRWRAPTGRLLRDDQCETIKDTLRRSFFGTQAYDCDGTGAPVVPTF